MKRLLLPILMALFGLGGGIGAGLFLMPAPVPEAEADGSGHADGGLDNPCGEMAPKAEPEPAVVGEDGEVLHDYVKLNNQFVVPVVDGADVAALVILSLSLELPPGMSERVYTLEPKLRDAFLQVLFDHANAGGFDGAFTAGTKMEGLRQALLETAQSVVGSEVTDVLIEDIVRQDA
jgi:hypothetical protein